MSRSHVYFKMEDINKEQLTRSQIYYRKNKEKCLARIKQHYQNNKEAYLKRTKKWQEDNDYFKETHYKAHIKRKHGITLDQYNEMPLKQNYYCAICTTPNHNSLNN